MDKKGQIDQLGSIIVTLIGIGIVLVIGFLILAETKEQIVKIEDTSSWCTDNLYGTYALVTSGGSANCCNSTACPWNIGRGGNYTYNVSANICCNTTASNDIGCNVGNTTTPTTAISCLAGNTTPAAVSLAWNGTETTQNAMQDIPGWLPIIVITVIGAILIGLVGIFRRK